MGTELRLFRIWCMLRVFKSFNKYIWFDCDDDYDDYDHNQCFHGYEYKFINIPVLSFRVNLV